MHENSFFYISNLNDSYLSLALIEPSKSGWKWISTKPLNIKIKSNLIILMS